MVNMAGIFSVHVEKDKMPVTVLDSGLNNGAPWSPLQIALPLLKLPSTQVCCVEATNKSIPLAGE